MKSKILLLLIGIVIGGIGIFTLLQSQLTYQEKTAQQWEKYYNQASSDHTDEVTWFKLGHDSGCVDGLVVSGVFLTQQQAGQQLGNIQAKIDTNKLNNPDQANINKSQLDALNTKFNNQQAIVNDCESNWKSPFP